MFFAQELWCICVADVSSINPLSEVCCDEELTLKWSAIHQTSWGENTVPYINPCWSKPIYFSVGVSLECTLACTL